MEIYKQLPECLQYFVNKKLMSEYVLKEMIETTQTKKPPCANCIYHGFPCLNCAYYIHDGKLGPGFHMNKRTLILSDADEDEEKWINMLTYVLIHGPINIELID